jgi:ribosomal protein L12E/L44/L45/RPP1/RPP2
MEEEEDEDEEEEEDEQDDRIRPAPLPVVETESCSALPRPEVVVTPSRTNVIHTSEESDEDDGMVDLDRKLTPSPPLPAAAAGQKPEQQQQDHYCLRWTNHGSHVLGVFAQLLRDESLVDVTLAAEGRSLRAHKMVLSACSSFFRTLFVSHSDQRHPIVILKDTKFTELESLLQFMYKGEVSVEYGQLATLLKTAENLRVKGLADVTTTATAAPKAKAEVEEEEEEDEEDDEEDEEDDEEEEDEVVDMFDQELEDATNPNPIVIERNALTSGLSSLAVGRIQRRQRRRHHLHNLSNPYRRSLLHPNLQLNPQQQLKASGRSAGLDVDSTMANHHRLVQQQQQKQKQQGSSGHYQRRGSDSVVPLDLIHPEVIQDLSSNTAASAGLLDHRRSTATHNSRRNNNNPPQQTNHLHHQIPGDWKPPNELQHPPRRQLKPSSNHQQQHNHHHHHHHQQKPQEAHRNDPVASGDRNSNASGGMENRNCDRDPDDGDHNHRFKSESTRNEHHNVAGGLEGSTILMDSMAQDSGTAQDLRRMPPHSPPLLPSSSLSPASPLPSGPPAAAAATATATSNAATSGGAAHPHQRFRHWMMEEESDESGEEVDGDEDMDETKTEEEATYLRRQGSSRRRNTSGSNNHPPSAIGSPQHLPMVRNDLHLSPFDYFATFLMSSILR